MYPPPFIQPISLPGVQYRLSPPSSSPAAHMGYNIGNPPPLHPSQQLTWDTISNQIKYIYLSQAQKHRKYHILEHIYKLETGGIDSQGLFNTQPPTGESVFAMMLTWRRGAAGCHAAHGMEGAGATGEDTVHQIPLKGIEFLPHTQIFKSLYLSNLMMKTFDISRLFDLIEFIIWNIKTIFKAKVGKIKVIENQSLWQKLNFLKKGS